MCTNSMPLACAQLHQNPPKAFWLCFIELVEDIAEISEVMLDDSVAQYASRHARPCSVPPAQADACYYFRHYRRLNRVHNTSVLVTFGQQPQVVFQTDVPNRDRRSLGSLGGSFDIPLAAWRTRWGSIILSQ